MTDPTTGDDALAHLTDLQLHVTQRCGTEPPFQNEFWDHKEEGLYLDIVSNEPLFASVHKYDSGTGWPSFTQGVAPGSLAETTDRSHGMVRTEVRSRKADSHLGHVFPDGPGPAGTRYCINSASLRFVPKDRLEEEGLGEYLELFDSAGETHGESSDTGRDAGAEVSGRGTP